MVIHGCHQFFLKLPKPEHARMLAFQPDALSVPVVLGYPYPSSATESVRPLAMGWPRLKVSLPMTLFPCLYSTALIIPQIYRNTWAIQKQELFLKGFC
jgi:hypothetical protein